MIQRARYLARDLAEFRIKRYHCLGINVNEIVVTNAGSNNKICISRYPKVFVEYSIKMNSARKTRNWHSKTLYTQSNFRLKTNFIKLNLISYLPTT